MRRILVLPHLVFNLDVWGKNLLWSTLSSSSRKDLVSGSFLRPPCSLYGHFYFILASEFSGLIWFTMFVPCSFYPMKFRLWERYTLDSTTFILFHLSTNGNFSLRVPQLYIRNVITSSPFFFKTLIFQANKPTAFCLVARGICQVRHLSTEPLSYPEPGNCYHAQRSYSWDRIY